jgi:hypothetical protein
MGRAIVGSLVLSTLGAGDHVVSRERVVVRSVTTADVARRLLAQDLLADAAMVGA